MSIYDWPEAVVDTPLGAFRVWSTGVDHIGVSGSESYDESGRKVKACTIRGVDYYLRLDLHPGNDESGRKEAQYPFDIKRWNFGSPDLSDIHLTRVDRYDPGSESAKRKVIAVILPLVNAWARSDEGQEAIAQAQRQRIAQAEERLKEEMRQKRAELNALRAELDALVNG